MSEYVYNLIINNEHEQLVELMNKLTKNKHQFDPKELEDYCVYNVSQDDTSTFMLNSLINDCIENREIYSYSLQRNIDAQWVDESYEIKFVEDITHIFNEKNLINMLYEYYGDLYGKIEEYKYSTGVIKYQEKLLKKIFDKGIYTNTIFNSFIVD